MNARDIATAAGQDHRRDVLELKLTALGAEVFDSRRDLVVERLTNVVELLTRELGGEVIRLAVIGEQVRQLLPRGVLRTEVFLDIFGGIAHLPRHRIVFGIVEPGLLLRREVESEIVLNDPDEVLVNQIVEIISAELFIAVDVDCLIRFVSLIRLEHAQIKRAASEIDHK